MAFLYETESSQVGLFFALAEKFGDDVFMSSKFKNGEPCNEWVDISWKKAAENIRVFGSGLIDMGIMKNDRVAIFSHNRPRWVINDLTIQGAGAVGVPVYPTSTDSQLTFILNDCEARALIAGDPELAKQALRIKDQVPSLKFIATMGPVGDSVAREIIPYDDMILRGKNAPGALNEFELRRKSIAIDDLAAIIYTSGTTGNPKGVVLTQDNFKSQTRLVIGAPITKKLLERQIRLTTLCHLPLCHIMGRASDYHAQMALGSRICFAESIQNMSKNLLEIRPQVLSSIPRLFEKIYEGVQQYARKLTGSKKKVFYWAMKAGEDASGYMIKGEKLPMLVGLKFALANILVYRHIRVHSGLDRLVSAISGGGPLAPEIITFFRSMNIIIAEGYGLTETTSPVSWNGPRFLEPLPDTFLYNKAFDWMIDTMVVMQGQGKSPFTSVIGFLKVTVVSKLILPRILIKPGFVGSPLDETQIKIAEDGEILVKGPQVFSQKHGYFNQPEKTAEAFTDDGFFKTGDIGAFDEDGFLKITDRKKELLVTSGGKNIAPQPIEMALIVDPYVDQACVIGDGRKYISALVVPQFGVLESYAITQGITFKDRHDLIGKKEILDLFDTRLALINSKFARYEQIKKIHLLPHGFSPETGELTPTMKMKRRVIYQKYTHEIESMYSA